MKGASKNARDMNSANSAYEETRGLENPNNEIPLVTIKKLNYM
jgi:hypothetical protein